MLWVCAGFGLLGTALAFAFLPGRVRETTEQPGGQSELSHDLAG